MTLCNAIHVLRPFIVTVALAHFNKRKNITLVEMFSTSCSVLTRPLTGAIIFDLANDRITDDVGGSCATDSLCAYIRTLKPLPVESKYELIGTRFVPNSGGQ